MVRMALNFDMDDEITEINTSMLSDDSGIHSEDDSSSPMKRSSPWYGDEDSSPKRRALQNNVSEDFSGVAKRLDETCSKDEDTVGDMSRPYCLPTINGKHPDLKGISSETMSRVLNNEFSDAVDKYVIVDCRYPYEYEGGHIAGAINIWERDSMSRIFSCEKESIDTQDKKTIIIFHCEFSSERGPKMARFLRQMDREVNRERYPFLCYPEIYLLEGGYKAFFQGHSSLCVPESYTPMDEPNFRAELKHFRAKSKTWKKEKSAKGRRLSYRQLKL